ncbi:MAG: sigma-70 family RNA polymerase sigma factor [Acidobacteriota bacterium]
MVDVALRTLQAEEEAALVSRSRAGDAEAFDALVTAYSGLVYNVALRQLGDREEAPLDLSQEVFLRVYRNLASFRGESSFKTWIYRIVINMGKNRQKWWRARRRDQTVPLERPATRADEEGLAPVDTLVDDRNGSRARCAEPRSVAARSRRSRGSLDGTPPDPGAARHGGPVVRGDRRACWSISEGTVKSRISCARQRSRTS